MTKNVFFERVAATCGRVVTSSLKNCCFTVQKYPNPYNVQLRLYSYSPSERVAEIYIPKTDRWLLLFWNDVSQFPDRPGCCFHLQENTDTDGPEGIIDHKHSRTLSGCLNALKKILDE